MMHITHCKFYSEKKMINFRGYCRDKVGLCLKRIPNSRKNGESCKFEAIICVLKISRIIYICFVFIIIHRRSSKKKAKTINLEQIFFDELEKRTYGKNEDVFLTRFGNNSILIPYLKNE